jgi:hypothetical protein
MSYLCEKACFWIEGQQLGEQVIGFCTCLWKQVLYLPEYKESESEQECSNWLSGSLRNGFSHSLCIWRIYRFDVLSSWHWSDFAYSTQLIEGRGAWKHWLATQQFTENTTHWPHIHRLGIPVISSAQRKCWKWVLRGAEENLRSTIPSGSNVLSKRCILFIRVDRSS